MPPHDSPSIHVACRWDVKIPMRDGVHLNATVYTPNEQRAPSPCILALTPYVADHCHDRAMYFASNGISFVAVDVRGRGNSEGVFRPHIQEANDGYDAVEWLASQPYCNGKVAMWGGSYLGYCQWAAAKEFPPHLTTIVPTASPYVGIDFPMRSNISYPYLVHWLALVSGRTTQGRLFADFGYWTTLFRRWNESGCAFRELDTQLGSALPIFQEWIAHPEPDEYWDARNPTVNQYARIDLPILTITGSYDDDQLGALEHYRQHMRHATPGARERHHLVIGPWDHGGTGRPAAEVGGVRFGPESLIDISKLHLEWYAWTMQDGPKPEFLQKRIAYYVMGAELWRYAETLEEITARHQPYFLESRSNAHDIFSSGLLGPTPGEGEPDVYTYDPREVQGREVDAETRVAWDSLVDQNVLHALRGRCLVYHSMPFERDTEVSGFFKLSAWVAIDCPDTDLYVSVHEIGLDGGSILLSTDAIRARYREGLRTPKLIQTREPLRYDFERFTFVSREIKRGHRLRLVIAPIGRLIYVPFTQRNFNGGGVVAEETAENAKPVTVRLFHDEAHPTALYVPFGRPSTGCVRSI